MPLPGGLTSITVTGTFADSSGAPLGGTVTFWPSAEITDATGHVIIGMTPVTAVVSGSTGQFSQVLTATDNAGLLPAGWTYKISVAVPGAQQVFNAPIPSSYGSTVDISVLGPVQPLPSLTGPFVVSVNGQSGQVSTVQLDTSAADIRPAGVTAAAGATGKAADAGHVHAGLALLATTGLSGFALQNGTPNILTWTAPNDGQMHRATLSGELVVTSTETGGAVQATITDPGGTVRNRSILNGGLGASFNSVTGNGWTVAPNTTVTVAQSSALTGGAAILYAELWGS